MPTKRTRDYDAEWPMYDDTVLCHLFESQSVPKSCSLLPNVGSAEHRRNELYLEFNSPFLLIQSRIRTSASAHTSMRHMI